ncbi:MAG TPA: hypothetical protein VFU21_02020 [Kofleriaceae bacterium]|nr:hypothetical protein [Kofleriaceae bacterium]
MGPPVRREDPIGPAAEELYGAPLSRFTAERKRLADALRAEGDRSLAARVAALARPTMAAWVVNQLWRRARGDMDDLMAAGQRMKRGEPGAWQAQRAALARLTAEAGEVLRGDRHAASPATLRRVTSTLQALSAVGSFAPDAPGRLVADRDPPGFEVLGDEADGSPVAAVAAAAAPASAPKRGTAGSGEAGGAGAPAARGRDHEPAAARADKERARAEGRAAVEQARAAAREKAERERQAEKARSRAASLGKTIERLRGEIEEMEEKLAGRREALESAKRERDAALDEAERAAPRRRTRS